jgi:hypothetical protein
MHLFELNSLGSDALLNFLSVFHQVCCTPYSHVLLFTRFIYLLTLLQHGIMQTIHISLMFFCSRVTLSFCPLCYLFTLHFITR